MVVFIDVVGTGGPIEPLMPEGTPSWFCDVMPDEIGGRAIVIMDPPSGATSFLRAILRSGRSILSSNKLAHTANDKRHEMNAVRERERSKGRLLQLLHL